MPGLEVAWEEKGWFESHPEDKPFIVAVVATEHLGQMEYKEVGDVFTATGMPEVSLLWSRDNPVLIDLAVKAVKDHQWPRCMVQCVERPGIHGKPQGVWYGMGGIATEWNLPAFACMGVQGGYWGTTARIERFDSELFVRQVGAMTQLTAELMSAELAAIKPKE
jgi:hypothetical protein